MTNHATPANQITFDRRDLTLFLWYHAFTIFSSDQEVKSTRIVKLFREAKPRLKNLVINQTNREGDKNVSEGRKGNQRNHRDHHMSNLVVRHYHAHQYVKVTVAPNKTEIGIVESAEEGEDKVVVATRHGYNITVKPRQLQRAFLLVLDLNGVLGARQKKTLFERRPHLERFLKFALANFVVAVWTSCEERNGKQIVEDLFSDDRDRLLFCLYRGDCTPNPTAERPFGTTKNLQRIFDRWPESFHAVNTVIVDDSADKCSHPDIALCPSQFSGLVEQPDDEGLLATIAVLEKVLEEDSLHPLIGAAAEHRKQLAEERARSAAPQCVASDPYDFNATLSAIASSAIEAPVTSPVRQDAKPLRCCFFFSGGESHCKFGARCKYAHVDDGVSSCNSGKKCRQHYRGHHVPEKDVQASPDLATTLSATGSATFNNLAATLLAKLNAASFESSGGQVEVHSGPQTQPAVEPTQKHVSSFFDSDVRRGISSSRLVTSELQSPLKQVPAAQQPHRSNYHQQHQHQHQREKHHGVHHVATNSVQPQRNVISILQNAQRVAN